MMLGETSLIPDGIASRPSSAPHALVLEREKPDDRREKPKAKGLGGLVLTRHLGESIMVGVEVEVQVVGIKAGTVRLKVIAPRTIAVHRREVFDAIRAGLAQPTALGPVADRPTKPGGGLVLARSSGQSMMIGDDVEVAVAEIRPATVKIKIIAPRSVAVHRREVFDAIRDGQA